MNIIGKTLALMALVPVALTIAGCGNNAEPVEKTAAGATISDDSLTAILDSNDALSGFNEIAGNSELEGLLAGGTPYTIFAPNNAALGKLPKDDLSALGEDNMKAQATELVRAHMVPGTILRADIEKAIKAGGKSITMKSFGDTTLTFTREGEAIKVTGDNGTSANLVPGGSGGKKGSVLVIDGLLLPVGADAKS